MKIILDIRDDKVAFIMELLSTFKFVKARPIMPYKAQVLEGISEAVEQVNQARQGKSTLKTAYQLLDELKDPLHGQL